MEPQKVPFISIDLVVYKPRKKHNKTDLKGLE